MKDLKKQLIEGLSTLLACLILLGSVSTFHGCARNEDYSVMKQNVKAPPKVINQRIMASTEKYSVDIKDTYLSDIKRLEGVSKVDSTFSGLTGTPDWDSICYVKYDINKAAYLVPIKENNITTSFLFSVPGRQNFINLIIKVTPTNLPNEKFSGDISYYGLTHNKMMNFHFADGKFVSQTSVGKGYPTKSDCSWECFNNCMNEYMAGDAVGWFICGLVCGSSFTNVFSAVACCACLGGTSLVCLDNCCDIIEE